MSPSSKPSHPPDFMYNGPIHILTGKARMPAPEIIHQLVTQFTQNREAYRSGKYNEAQLRQEFLNPFFEALGWDMVNRSGYAPQNREVIHEDSIDVEGGSRAPDYCFRLGQTRKFFVEAG